MPFRSLDDLITDITDTMLEVADSSNDPIVAYENLLESLPRIIRLLIDGVLVNSGDSVKISLVNGLATRVRSQIMTRIRVPAERHTLVDPATLTVPLRNRHHWIRNMGQTTLCTCGYCSLEIEEGEVTNLRDNPCPGRRIDYAPEIEISSKSKRTRVCQNLSDPPASNEKNRSSLTPSCRERPPAAGCSREHPPHCRRS
jgi:hypothetical protein